MSIGGCGVVLFDLVLQMPVGDEDVFVTIVVHVEEIRAPPEVGNAVTHARSEGHIAEEAVAFVTEEFGIEVI